VRIEFLREERIADFAAYCRRHRKGIDESFLYDDDLERFRPSEEDPTYILANERGEVVGAASLILDEYRRSGRAGRFRILHVERESLDAYQALMQAMLRHSDGLDRLYVFVPTANTRLIEIVQGLGFSAERYSFALVRGDLKVPDPCFPEGYQVMPFIRGTDEEIWCQVRNAAFANLKGSEAPITPSMVAEMAAGSAGLDGGMLILFHGERPVGVVRGAVDEYEGLPAMEIAPLAIIPDYQGRGLGRSLLRTALKLARDRSFSQTILSVNAENERAVSLYEQEGFRQVEAVVCYGYKLSPSNETP
jgi:mycothiol synthase